MRFALESCHGRRTKDIQAGRPSNQSVRVLIRKDEDRKQTKSGIHLPDKIEIPTLTGRVVAISAQVEHDEDYPIKQYDRVLFNPNKVFRSTSRATIDCS